MSIILQGCMKIIIDDDWYMIAISTDKVKDIGTWCRTQFGSMLTEYAQMGRWYGSHIMIAGNRQYFVALRDEQDYLLYSLKWD